MTIEKRIKKGGKARDSTKGGCGGGGKACGGRQWRAVKGRPKVLILAARLRRTGLAAAFRKSTILLKYARLFTCDFRQAFSVINKAMDLIFQLFTNADRFLITLATDYGWLVYVAMFLIFFCETGCVIMAFLPGDSLLFVAGTVAAAGTMSPWGLMLAVTLGACLGNTVGFHTGRWLGNKIYDGSIRWINAEKLSKTQIFYEKHGGKTIVLARFVPIVRAFAPLVAGAARMSMARFELYSGLGALIWAVSLIGVGYLFGNIPIVKDNLSMILLLGVVCAAMGPVVVAIGWKYVHQLADKMRREKNDKIEKAMNVNTQTARERK